MDLEQQPDLKSLIESISRGQENQRIHNEQWRYAVHPAQEVRNIAMEHAYGLAKIAIQTTYLLNGGALIAFPAFAEIVSASMLNYIYAALGAIAAFVFGLVFSSITTIFAYICQVYYVDNTEWRIREISERVAAAGLNDDRKKRHSSEAKKADLKANEYFKKANRFRKWAVLFGSFSILSFIFGAICAMRVLAGPQADQIFDWILFARDTVPITSGP